MYRKNEQHLQWPLISDLDDLPAKLKERLEGSWAGTFYREVFVRLDEGPFALLYSEKGSRPNIPINVLVGLEILKAGYGWSDEELYDHYCFDLQVRYALGYRHLSQGQFELRTLYNFRGRLSEHMQQSGEDLLEQAFVQVSDEQVAAYGLKTDKLRMDSTQVSSNIRHFSRLQLLVEVLRRVHRELSAADRQAYESLFAPYLKGSAGQYVYRVKPADYEQHLAQVGQVMAQLVAELAASYAQQPGYQLLVRVFQEHFIVDDSQAGDDDDPPGLRARQGDELSAASLQSPDDQVASYRCKRGQPHSGYVANVAETCHPENPFQLLLDLQTQPNTTDDAVMLVESLPALKQRTGLDELHTDGGYNSPQVDLILRQEQVSQVQTAIRGRHPNPDTLNLDDLTWELDPDGQPLSATAPGGQQAQLSQARKPGRYIARFDPLPDDPAPSDKPPPKAVYYFSQQQLDLAIRRQRSAQAAAQGEHLRPAVEASIGALKRPFGNDKLPVRGQVRMHHMLLGSVFMVNLRRIQRYLDHKKQQKQPPTLPDPSFSFAFPLSLRLLFVHLSFFCLFGLLQP
jgi:hypothetical protein